MEPVRAISTAQARLGRVDAERRYRAERQLAEAIEGLPASIKPEALVAYGEPAEEIAKVMTDRDAGIIVMGLDCSALLGPAWVLVTYRVLCLAHRLVRRGSTGARRVTVIRTCRGGRAYTGHCRAVGANLGARHTVKHLIPQL